MKSPSIDTLSPILPTTLSSTTEPLALTAKQCNIRIGWIEEMQEFLRQKAHISVAEVSWLSWASKRIEELVSGNTRAPTKTLRLPRLVTITDMI